MTNILPKYNYLIATYTHSAVHNNELCKIIELKYNKQYFKNKTFLYDLNLYSRHTDYYKVNLLIKLSNSGGNNPEVYAKYVQGYTYQSKNLKLYYTIESDNENIYFKVYINHNSRSYVYWEIKPNYINNLYCIDSLNIIGKDIYKISEIDTTNSITEFIPDTMETSEIKTDYISKKDVNSNGIIFKDNIIPSSHTKKSIGRPDMSFRNLWLSHYIKMPNKNKTEIETSLQDDNVTNQSSIMFCNTGNNKQLSFYNQNDSKIYDVFGVSEDEQFKSFNPLLVGDSVEGAATYNEQHGECIRVGKLLFINIRITAVLDNTIDGFLKIKTHLPTKKWGTVNIGYSSGFTNNPTSGYFNDDGEIMLRYRASSNGNSNKISINNDRGNTVIIYLFGVSYVK